MEKLPFLKNRRKPLTSRPSAFITASYFCILVLIIAVNIAFSIQEIHKARDSITHAPVDPQKPSELAFIPFHADRSLIADPLTQAGAIANRLDRSVSQYRQLTKSPDLILFPVLSEPEGFRKNPRKELSLWSLQITPPIYTDGFYKISSSQIGAEHMLMRTDLVKIAPSSFDRWVQTGINKIFIGAKPKTPADGEYKIEYSAYVLPKLCILGSVDEKGFVSAKKIFITEPGQPDPKTSMLLQISYFYQSLISLHIMMGVSLCLILMRELSSPKDSKALYSKVAQATHYDLLLSPLVLIVPQTQQGASIFCLIALSYMTFKIFLKRSVLLVERERINLYR